MLSPLIREEAVDLLLHTLATQFASFSRVEKGGIGHRTPQEIGNARGQFPFGKAFAGRRLALDEVDEVARRQYAMKGDAISFGGLFTGTTLGAIGFQVFLQLLDPDRSTPGAFRKTTQMLRNDLGRGVLWR